MEINIGEIIVDEEVNIGEIELDVIKYDDTQIQQDISEIKQKNTEQDKTIQNNTESIEELKAENTLLKSQIPKGQESGENITLNDSSNMEMELRISGNSIQEGIPTPESSVDIQNVTGSANVTVCNENLVNVQDFIEALSTLYQGEELYNNKNCIKLGRVQTADTSYKYMLNGLKENTQYTIQLNATLVGNNSGIDFVYSDGSNSTITSGKTSADLIKITASSKKNKTLTGLRISCFSWNKYWYIEKDSIQLEEGTVATEYQPHQSQQFPFPLAQGQKLMLGDYLADDGIHHKRKQTVLDGTENWVLYNNDSHIFSIAINNIKRSLCKCSHFKGIESGLTSIDYVCLVNNHGIYINDKDITGIDNWKTYLAEQYANGTPVVVEYDLAEEEIESYTEEQQTVYNENKKTAHSYKNITHIFSTDEISPIFDVTYSKDLETILNNMQAQILAE